MPDLLLTTPLHAEHLALGGRMVPFAGYDMPVQYTGIVAEAKAVRESAGMFDVSHMARLRFNGEQTLAFLEWITSNDVGKLGDGQGQYSLLPNDQGGCVDDIIVYRIGENEFRMVVNAANHAKDVDWIRAQNQFGVEMADLTESSAMIAVQGPRAVATIATLCDSPAELDSAPAFGVVMASISGIECFAARSGYTGEDGYELICSAADGPRLWQSLLQAGVVPCGLGSRDVLRVEAGLPLYGHELNDSLSPIAAGLGWVVSKTKQFLGSGPINQVRAEGPSQKLQGVLLDGKRLLVPEMGVYVEGRKVGEISSGVFSPTLERSIAFAFVDSDIAHGTKCEIDVRGTRESGTIVNKRFLRK